MEKKSVEEVLKEVFDNYEYIEREVKEYGTSAHINIPKRYRGKVVKIFIPIKKNGNSIN